MSTSKTENLKLHQWSPADPVSLAEVNANFAALDAAVAGGSSGEALAAEAAVREAADGELAESIAGVKTLLGTGGKNARVVFGRYVGTGTYGSSNVNRLEFDFRPVLVIVAQSNGCVVMVRDSSVAYNPYGGTVNLDWRWGALMWDSTSAQLQCNTNGVGYPYLALGDVT
jgi:hypothetical protein